MFYGFGFKRFTSAICLVLISLVPSGVGPRSLVPSGVGPSELTTEPQSYATVIFTSKLSPEAAVAVLQIPGARVIELRYSYTSRGVTWSGGLFESEALTPVAWAQRLTKAHAAGVVDILGDVESLAARVERTRQLEEKISSLRYAVEAYDAAPSIWGASILVSPAANTRLRSDPMVKSIKVIDGRRPTLKNAKPRTSHVDWSYWVPDEIYLQIQPSYYAGERYSQMQIKWNAGRSLWFGDQGDEFGAYEADMYLSAAAGTYITRDEGLSGPLRIPKVYYTTDFPYQHVLYAPYLDTRAGDDPDRYSYTIGTPSARWIVPGNWNTTYIRGANGDANSDAAIAPPQLGVCYEGGQGCDTWTVFSHETCPYPWPPLINVPTNPDPWHWTRQAGGAGQGPCP